MLIDRNSQYYLKKIRAKAKMYEYGVPDNLHIKVEEQASDLLILSIGIVGDIANEIYKMEQAPVVLSIEKEKELYFVSRFFDSYFQSKISIDFNPYCVLMAAITYYFSNMNGSSKVMMNIMKKFDDYDFEASNLEKVIIWLLDGEYTFDMSDIDVKYVDYIKQIVKYHDLFFACKNPEKPKLNNFRKFVYSCGNSREILFCDIILAILKKKEFNSCINLMPHYSGIEKNIWSETFKNNTLIKEMWTSQIILGEKGIFKGKSGVVQMPTSSGKTTSVSLAIQSAFLSHRTSIVIVVAPFRALCKEILHDLEDFFYFDNSIIITEFSDVPEFSEIQLFDLTLNIKRIVVMTPEKLAYILKHNTELINAINMIVFDEAHLFDDVTRGTDYELLLATINTYLNPKAQKILVSAVISNADQLNDWFNTDGVVIKNDTIKTTEKTVAFNSFVSSNSKNMYSNLYFVDPNKSLEEEFYVPRVIQTIRLEKKGKERKIRYFPDLNNNQDVGIYYALKLINNGSIAIFCTKKNIVNKTLERFLELERRGISLDEFTRLSGNRECVKISNLIREHLGDNYLCQAALNGIVGHHSDIPNGIRIAEEYALKKSLIRCVVCTSTLAQGVNLPIKYLIISSLYQSKNLIKVRDFHNLIGRTARAGKETEGTIILTEGVYKNNDEKYKLDNYKKLLNADNSEACSSNLLKLVRKIYINKDRYLTAEFIKKFYLARYNSNEKYNELKKRISIARANGKKYSSEIYEKIKEIEHILVSLENFILSFAETDDESLDVIRYTYGYYLANEEEKIALEKLYGLIKDNVDKLDSVNKNIFRKSMLGILNMKELSTFVDNNLEEILSSDFGEIINMISQLLKDSQECKIIPKLLDDEHLSILLRMWLDGENYFQIWNYSREHKILVKRGKTGREIKLEDIVTLCDLDFAYVSLSIIQAIIEVLNTRNCGDNIQEMLNDILYRIRYGLPDKTSVYLYELGFSDRVIAQKLSKVLNGFNCSTKNKTKRTIRRKKENLRKVLLDYPSYYLDRLEKIR